MNIRVYVNGKEVVAQENARITISQGKTGAVVIRINGAQQKTTLTKQTTNNRQLPDGPAFRKYDRGAFLFGLTEEQEKQAIEKGLVSVYTNKSGKKVLKVIPGKETEAEQFIAALKG